METNFLMRLLTLILYHLPVIPSFAAWEEDVCVWGAEQIVDMVQMFAKSTTFLCDLFSESAPIGTDDVDIISALNNSLENLETNIVKPVLNGSASLGAIIGFVGWLFAVIELLIQDRLTPETLIKSLARLGLVVALTSNTEVIYDKLRQFGKDITAGVNGLIPQEDLPADVSFQNLDPKLWFSMIMTALMISIVMLAATAAIRICGIIIQVSRLLEISIRGAFLGIAFGLIADDGWKGAGGRYIKKFVAVCAQAAVLVLIGAAISTVELSVLEVGVLHGGSLDLENIPTYWASIFSCIGVAFAGISIMFKSLGYVNDVFGA